MVIIELVVDAILCASFYLPASEYRSNSDKLSLSSQSAIEGLALGLLESFGVHRIRRSLAL